MVHRKNSLHWGVILFIFSPSKHNKDKHNSRTLLMDTHTHHVLFFCSQMHPVFLRLPIYTVQKVGYLKIKILGKTWSLKSNSRIVRPKLQDLLRFKASWSTKSFGSELATIKYFGTRVIRVPKFRFRKILSPKSHMDSKIYQSFNPIHFGI